MKKLIVGLAGVAGGLALFATSGSVMAAGTYTLTDVGSWNTYTTKTPTPVPTLTGGPIPFGGTATVTTSGNFTATGVQYSFVNANATFNYTSGSWSGSVGLGGTVNHTETCVDAPGNSACSGSAGGLSGIWAHGIRNDGGADEANCYGANFAPGSIPPQCNNIAVTENPGVSFVVWEASAFAAPYTGSGSRYTFTSAVPVPAAVWLFGSGLGLLGWVRRRAAK